MSVVYVVQNQHKMDDRSGHLVPKFDLSTAEEHGELRFLLSPSASPFNPESIIRDLRAGLTDYGKSDALLLIGGPALIGWACALAAARTGGFVTTLQWSGRDQRYIRIQADLRGRE